jgi:hypothetical protein
MQHANIAASVGLNAMDIDRLLKGQATHSLAAKVGVTTKDIEDFIEGFASESMKKRLGLNNVNVTSELAQLVGRQGAIGILLGLLIQKTL